MLKTKENGMPTRNGFVELNKIFTKRANKNIIHVIIGILMLGFIREDNIITFLNKQ